MSPRKTRRHRGPALCRNCRAPIAFFRSPFTDGVRIFNAKPVDMRGQLAEVAYPVLGRQAYRLRDVVDQLMVMRQCSHGEAEEEARDLPWHTLHACPIDQDHTDDAQGGTR